MKKLLVPLTLVLIIGGLAVVYYQYNKPHINVSEESIDINTTIDQIVNDFQTNSNQATINYYDKIILLSGTYSSLETSENNFSGIILKGKNQVANCEMDMLHWQKNTSLALGDQITIKGLFVGYDELLGELQLKKCVLIH